MHYTNLHTRMPSRLRLNHGLQQRITDCRARSQKARTHAEKIALASRLGRNTPPTP